MIKMPKKSKKMESYGIFQHPNGILGQGWGRNSSTTVQTEPVGPMPCNQPCGAI